MAVVEGGVVVARIIRVFVGMERTGWFGEARTVSLPHLIARPAMGGEGRNDNLVIVCTVQGMLVNFTCGWAVECVLCYIAATFVFI